VSDTTAGSFNWLYWLLPAAAVAALLIYLFTKPAEHVVQQGVTTAQSLTVNGLDVGKQLPDTIASLRATLESVTDATTAQAALPKLQDITAQIDRIDGLVGQMTPEQRKLLAGIVNPLMPTVNQLFDKVLAVPGVAELLKPAIDTFKAKLAILAA
jgi:hypothetical protein